MNIQSYLASITGSAFKIGRFGSYCYCAVTLLVLTMISSRAQTTLNDSTDGQVSSTGSITFPTSIMAGYSSTTALDTLVAFHLPTLPAGQQFSTANLSLYLSQAYLSPAFNADVYGLIPSASSTILNGYFSVGPADVNSTMVQPAFYNSSSTSGRVGTSSRSLVNYLNNAYANGAGAGQYLFFRVNPSVAGLSNYSRYITYSGSYSGGAYYWPQLTYTTSMIGWATVPLGGGGFVSGLMCDSTGNDVYCRSDVGGAFRWDPANAAWNSITDAMVPVTTTGGSSTMSIVSLAVDPSNSNQIYVAAGGNATPEGIYSSSDRGASWTNINPSTSIVMLGNGTFRSCGERLAVDPNNSNIVWFGSSQTGLYKGTNSGGSWTWTQIPSASVPFGAVGSGENAGVTFVACDKNSGSTIVYAGVYDSAGSTGGVYTSADSGSTWSKVGGASLPTPLRAAIAQGSGTLYATTGTFGVGKMTRGGTISQLSTLPAGTSFRGVTTDSTGTLLYVAASTSSNGQWNNMWRSTDGGTTWHQQSTNIANAPANIRQEPDGTLNLTGYWFGNVSSLLLNPANSNELFAADFFGVYWSPDAADLGTTTGCYWYTIQQGQEDTVANTLKNAPTGARLLNGPGDVGGFLYNDITQRPLGAAGSALTCPGGGNNSCFDFCEGNNNVWVRVWDDTSGHFGTGAVSNDGGKTWIAFGGIVVQNLTNSPSPATVTYDLTTYLKEQKALGTNTVTLVLAAYKGDSTGTSMAFDSIQGSTPPKLVVNGSTNLTATADSYVNSGAGNNNYGTATNLLVTYGYSSSGLRSFLKFDLSSVSSITSATLQLNRESSGNTETFTVGVYGCIDTSWTETGITWNNQPATLAATGSYTDIVYMPNYFVGATHLQGGRVAISATNPDNMVWLPEGTTNYPYYSTDRGVTWTVCSGAPKSEVSNLYTPGPILSQLTSDRSNGNFYIASFGTAGGGSSTIYSSTNGGATFSAVGTCGGYYNPYRSQIVAAPAANDVWISDDGVSGTTNGGLWHSVNGGVTWSKEANLTAVSEVTFGAPKPGSGEPYSVFFNGYKSTVRGIYRSDDLGSTWTQLSSVPTNSGIISMAGDRQNYGYVFIGTGGRGVYLGH